MLLVPKRNQLEVVDPVYLRGRLPTPKGALIYCLTNFSKKLHTNEEILAEESIT